MRNQKRISSRSEKPITPRHFGGLCAISYGDNAPKVRDESRAGSHRSSASRVRAHSASLGPTNLVQGHTPSDDRRRRVPDIGSGHIRLRHG
jgi:hypothetical protein